MNNIFVLLLLGLAIHINVFGQDYSIVINNSRATTKFGTKASFKVSQANFSKWSAGGQNLTNFLGDLLLASKHISSIYEWENTLSMIYGRQSLEYKSFRKTDDIYEFNSKYGLKTQDPRLLITIAIRFKSQFANGYTYDDKDIASLASTPFAPAYLTGYLGLDYKPFVGLSIFLAPFSARTTIVANEFLSKQGAYGVFPGNTFLQAYGTNLTINLNKELLKNFKLNSKLDLFSNYNKVSSIIINWDTSLDFKINKLLLISLSTGIMYDENIKWKETETINGQEITISEKPQVQYKQLLSIGLIYTL